jgi:hypothetical protein
MIQELDPNPFFMRLANFGTPQNSPSVLTGSRSLPSYGTALDDLLPAGRVVPAYVLRRAGLLDRVVPNCLTHVHE